MKKNVITLGICFLLGSGIVLVLYAASNKIVHTPNSFLRIYKKNVTTRINELDLDFNSYYVAGITGDRIVLGNITAPSKLLLINNNLADSQHVTLRIRNINNPTIHQGSTIKLHSPYFYIADGVEPVIYRGRTGQWEADRFGYDDHAYFTQIIPIGNASFAIRTNMPGSFDNVLGKVQSDSPRIQLKPSLLQKQIDGVFCTDGQLLYNRDLKQLIYMYYYRNEYIVYDTSLQLSYRGHTIDTFSRAQINVGYINSSKSKQLMSKTTVNIRGATSGNYLFIMSGLLARNDGKDSFLRNSIIDVYDLRTDNYRFSFSLPKYNQAWARDIFVVDKTLIALYDHYVVQYHFNEEEFQ